MSRKLLGDFASLLGGQQSPIKWYNEKEMVQWGLREQSRDSRAVGALGRLLNCTVVDGMSGVNYVWLVWTVKELSIHLVGDTTS